MLIIGSSGSGKTTLLFRALIKPEYIDYNNIIIFTTTPKQQEYQLLYQGFKNGLTKSQLAALVLNQRDFHNVPISILCKEYAKTLANKDNITITLSSNTNDIIHPDMLDKNRKHLIVFDDCVNKTNQLIMSEYFSRGRHSNCNCIYLSQSYFDLNRSIRLNSNFLILFELTQRNKTEIYSNIVSTMMDKTKFKTLTDNIWSMKYGYIAINRDDKRIYTDIFNEKSGHLQENQNYSNEYRKTTDEHIKQMGDVIEQREQLKSKFQTHDLAQRGLYEQAAKMQEPTIKAIRETQLSQDTSRDEKAEITQNKAQNVYKNLQKISIGSAYSLIQTKDSLYVNNLKERFDLWKFNSSSKGNVGLFIIFTHKSKEYIWNKSFLDYPVEISPGLNEILFNNAANHDSIQSNDVKQWESLVTQAGLGSSYKSSKIYHSLSKPVVVVTEGDGLNGGCKDIITVPSRPDDLINELNLQLQATKAGHNNTFDYSNALMKEMLKQRIIKAKDYREILRDYYHI